MLGRRLDSRFTHNQLKSFKRQTSHPCSFTELCKHLALTLPAWPEARLLRNGPAPPHSFRLELQSHAHSSWRLRFETRLHRQRRSERHPWLGCIAEPHPPPRGIAFQQRSCSRLAMPDSPVDTAPARTWDLPSPPDPAQRVPPPHRSDPAAPAPSGKPDWHRKAEPRTLPCRVKPQPSVCRPRQWPAPPAVDFNADSVRSDFAFNPC